MLSSFKNTELFRYFIRVDLNKNVDKIIKENSSNFSLVAGSIFSGSFSILGTYFGMNEHTYGHLKSILFSTFLFSILFIIGMFLFKISLKLIFFLYNSCKKENLPSKSKIKELIDDFDHIACDNILISQNFIIAYNDKNTSTNLKEFYFYEIIYYTKVSISIINKILINQNKCINDKKNTNRIHLFRLENSIKMLKEIYTFLNTNQKFIRLDTSMSSSLSSEIFEINNQLISFQKQYETLAKNIYS